MCVLSPFPLPTLVIQFTFASGLGCCYNILPEHPALSQPSPSIFLRGIIRPSKFSTLIKSRPSLGCRFLVASHQEERSPYSGLCQNPINVWSGQSSPFAHLGLFPLQPLLAFLFPPSHTTLTCWVPIWILRSWCLEIQWLFSLRPSASREPHFLPLNVQGTM